MVAAYLIDPAAARTTRARRAGGGRRRRGRRRRDELAERRGAARARSPSASARADRGAGPRAACSTTSSCRWSTCWSRWSGPGIKLDTDKARGDRARRSGAGIAELEREIHELAGEEFTIGSPQQLSTILFEKLGLSKKRRGKTGFSTDARVLAAIRDEHEIIAKIESWRELTKLKSTYLDALPQLLDERRPPAHDLQPDGDHHRPPVEHQPQPAEHPDPHRAGARDPRLLHRRGGHAARLGRLLAGRAADPRAHLRRGGAARTSSSAGEDVHAATAGEIFGVAPERDRPRHALEGEDGQLRDRLRAVGVRDGRPAQHPAGGGGRVHRPLPGPLPEGEGVHRRDDRQATADGYVRTLLGRMRRIPELRSSNCQTRQLGERLAVNTVDPGNGRGHHQDRDGALPTTRCAMRAARARAPDPRRAAVRGARRRGRRGREIVVREMARGVRRSTRRWRSTPASANWMEAK